MTESAGKSGESGAGGFFRVELLTDIGAFGPFPKFIFFAGLRVGFFEGEPFSFESKAIGVEFGATQPGNIGGEIAEASPLGVGVGVESGQAMSGGGVLKEEPTGEFVGARLGEVGMAIGVFVLEGAEEIECLLAGEPFAEAALPPFGEVLFKERTAVEVFGEDGAGFGQGVEPVENFMGGMAVAEALIELFADGVREAGDFSIAHKIKFLSG